MQQCMAQINDRSCRKAKQNPAYSFAADIKTPLPFIGGGVFFIEQLEKII